MAQGLPETSVEVAVEAAMQAVQVVQPQHMVHHMPQQAPQVQQQPQHMVHHMPQQAQAPQMQQQSQNYTYQYVAQPAQIVLQPGENLNYRGVYCLFIFMWLAFLDLETFLFHPFWAYMYFKNYIISLSDKILEEF